MAISKESDEFSKRLRSALRQAGISFESPTRLADEFSARNPSLEVTQQAVRKWLNGEAIPTQPKVQALSAWLGVGPEWLRFGTEPPAEHSAQQSQAAYRAAYSESELVLRYRQLAPANQRTISEVIASMVGKRR